MFRILLVSFLPGIDQLLLHRSAHHRLALYIFFRATAMDQAYKPVGSADLDTQGLGGRQEIDGGGSSNKWMQDVRLNINLEAEGVFSSSLPLNLQMQEQISTNKPRPSIFMPRRQVVSPPIPMPKVARMPTLDHGGAASANSIGSTGGNVMVVAVGPYHPPPPEPRSALITSSKKCAIVEFLARPEFGLDTAAFLGWALDNDTRTRGCYEWDPCAETVPREKLAEILLLDGCLVLLASSCSGRGRRAYCVGTSGHIPHVWQRTYPSQSPRGPRGVPSSPRISSTCLQRCPRTRNGLGWTCWGSSATYKSWCFDDIRPSPSPNHNPTSPDLRFPPTIHHLLHLFHWSRVPSGKHPVDPSSPLPGEPESSPVLHFPPIIHHLLHLFHWSRVPSGKDVVDTSSPLPGEPESSPGLRYSPTIHHLLHLFRWSRVPSGKRAVEPLLGEPESSLPCATWFEDSLVGFSKHAAAEGALDIAFQRKMLGARGVLRVPALHIHGYNGLVFQNLIAFEQSHLGCGFGATTYSICMARLLQSEADAKLLRNNGILAHTYETDKEIVELFKGLADEFGRDAFYSRELLELCRAVDGTITARPRGPSNGSCFSASPGRPSPSSSSWGHSSPLPRSSTPSTMSIGSIIQPSSNRMHGCGDNIVL
uniref:Uncharacterized protein n=1 Tax=Avena sativa TaxID=4498 RepID=A0ACD5W9R9_AVESA